jgi:hypothetical protein
VQITLAAKELDELFRGVTWTRPTQWYLGLDKNVSGTTYSEPTYTGYARVALPRATGTWTDPAGTGQVSNVSAFTFTAPPSGYTAGETIHRYLISNLSAAGGGELLFDFGSVLALTLTATVAPQLAAGAVILGSGS